MFTRSPRRAVGRQLNIDIRRWRVCGTRGSPHLLPLLVRAAETTTLSHMTNRHDAGHGGILHETRDCARCTRFLRK
jgi:hypothetical protein